jgi:hypothetical protein
VWSVAASSSVAQAPSGQGISFVMKAGQAQKSRPKAAFKFLVLPPEGGFQVSCFLRWPCGQFENQKLWRIPTSRPEELPFTLAVEPFSELAAPPLFFT